MKVLITGANGLLGGRLSDFLKSKNIKVTKIFRGDLKVKKLKKYFSKVDTVINCIGLDSNSKKSSKALKKANYLLPIKLFELANAANVNNFFLISTFHVYKSEKKINERSRLEINNDYSKYKIMCERVLIKKKNKKTKLIIIRSCNLFGYPITKSINCWRLLINNLILNLKNKKKIIINSYTDVSRTYSSIYSFCIFIFNILKNNEKIKFKKKLFICNYTSNFNLKISEVIKLILKYFKSHEKFICYRFSDYYKRPVVNKFESLFQRKFKAKKDMFFYMELKKTINFLQK